MTVRRIPGPLVAIEGLDQSGKETQARLLGPWFESKGWRAELLGFPDYATTIGHEIGEALQGRRQFSPEVMQLLYVANRHEWKQSIGVWRDEGRAVVCDRYLASSVAYGQAQGLDPAWLTVIQATLPQPDVTILLDIAPQAAAARKPEQRDRFEQDLALLGRVRSSYLGQAVTGNWIVVDADHPKEAVFIEIIKALAPRLGLT